MNNSKDDDKKKKKGCCCGGKKDYPVEPFPETDKPTEEDVKEATEEINPDPDSMDDERG